MYRDGFAYTHIQMYTYMPTHICIFRGMEKLQQIYTYIKMNTDKPVETYL